MLFVLDINYNKFHTRTLLLLPFLVTNLTTVHSVMNTINLFSNYGYETVMYSLIIQFSQSLLLLFRIVSDILQNYNNNIIDL